MSLGPGDGQRDAYTTLRLLNQEGQRPVYYGVDASSEILDNLVVEFSSQRNVRTVLANFEENIFSIISRIHEETPGPIVISLTGFTFGNFIKPEGRFFTQLRKAMGPKDHFIFDYLAFESHFDVTKYVDTILNSYPPELKEFLVQEHGHDNRETFDRVANWQFDNTSEVPGVVPLRLDISGQSNHEERFYNFKRYEINKFKEWLAAQGFEIVSHVFGYDDKTQDAPSNSPDPFSAFGLTVLTPRP